MVHAKHAELAHEGVADDLENMGQNMKVGVGHGLKRLRFGSYCCPKERWRVALERAGRELRQRIEQLRHTGTGLGRDEEDGNQVAVAQCFLEQRVQFGRLWIGAVFQVARQHAFILLHDLVNERAVRCGHRGKVALALVMA